ncbi:MAG: tRNA (N(6)-L-threonylcarbamoyladenosine(37)-C(2))-methylthiotransferase MtaB [Holosporales bacterium]|jgi:threonylcarbamoyladenosine tRNA methylthiotransferase MtaB|nr:tRNA (N(6)-L-threonylcarbamoyladenosine(37)-C(2))-methylthiotransferase MtaB [Holosporales bacterium]
MPSVKTITLGCRFNSYESEVAKAALNAAKPERDVVVINTCAVTREAERQSRQAVRKAIRENKGADIIVTGCAVKTSYDYFKSLDGVCSVVPNDEKNAISSRIPRQFSVASTTDVDHGALFRDKIRAFLQIQNGCDNWCSYCIVPITRGASRSLPVGDILRRVESLLTTDCKEIVLSGIDITSYGKELNGPCQDLADVIEAILSAFPEVTRLRISSLDPHGVDERLQDLFVKESRIMPHFHLSIQSGDNSVLKAMKRRHTRDDVVSLCQYLLNRRAGVVLGGDLIAGFPTETDAMFQNTLNLIDDANLTLAHVFPYSPRSGTVAANMIQNHKSVIAERAKTLRDKAHASKQKLFESLTGSTVSGIVEECTDEIAYGKTDSFIPLQLIRPPSIKVRPGDLVSADIVRFTDDWLVGNYMVI